jgi:hypothetical protein
MSASNLYHADFYAWAQEQASLLRAGNLAAADIAHIAEEIESIGRTEKRELVNRLSVLTLHLLKYQYQPTRRSPSWQATICVQRRDLAAHMADNPSLKAVMPAGIKRAYDKTVIEAGAETDLLKSTFPQHCPGTFKDMLNPDFWSDV